MKKRTFWLFNLILILLTAACWLFGMPFYLIATGILGSISILYGLVKELKAKLNKRKEVKLNDQKRI